MLPQRALTTMKRRLLQMERTKHQRRRAKRLAVMVMLMMKALVSACMTFLSDLHKHVPGLAGPPAAPFEQSL